MFITNRISLWLTYLMLPTRITPNQVTVLSLLFSLLCAALYAHGHFLTGSLFLFLSHVFDCADGNLARARKQYSSHGKLLDMICDRAGESMIFVGVAYHYWGQSELLAYLALVDGLLLLLYYYVVDVTLLLKQPPSAESQVGKFSIDGVALKWGIMEPVIYGFIFFSLIGLLSLQIYLVFGLVIIGLGFQFYKTGRMLMHP